MGRQRCTNVIDMHTHIGPDYVDMAIEVMDRNGIAAMFDFSADTGERFRHRMDVFKRYPGRFFAMGGIDFQGFGEEGWTERACAQVRELLQLGAVGIKVHKGLGLRYLDNKGSLIRVDDERFAPVFETVGEAGGVLAFHIADPRAFFQPYDENNERWAELRVSPQWWFGDKEKYPMGWWDLISQLERVVLRHPSVPIVGTHFGCAAEELSYVANLMRRAPHYHIDTAARVGEFGRHGALAVREFFAELGDRVLFGTDLGVRKEIMLGAPHGETATQADIDEFFERHWRYYETAEKGLTHPSPIQGDWTVDGLGLPEDQLKALYRNNTARLFALAELSVS